MTCQIFAYISCYCCGERACPYCKGYYKSPSKYVQDRGRVRRLCQLHVWQTLLSLSRCCPYKGLSNTSVSVWDKFYEKSCKNRKNKEEQRVGAMRRVVDDLIQDSTIYFKYCLRNTQTIVLALCESLEQPSNKLSEEETILLYTLAYYLLPLFVKLSQDVVQSNRFLFEGCIRKCWSLILEQIDKVADTTSIFDRMEVEGSCRLMYALVYVLSQNNMLPEKLRAQLCSQQAARFIFKLVRLNQPNPSWLRHFAARACLTYDTIIDYNPNEPSTLAFLTEICYQKEPKKEELFLLNLVTLLDPMAQDMQDLFCNELICQFFVSMLGALVGKAEIYGPFVEQYFPSLLKYLNQATDQLLARKALRYDYLFDGRKAKLASKLFNYMAQYYQNALSIRILSNAAQFASLDLWQQFLELCHEALAASVLQEPRKSILALPNIIKRLESENVEMSQNLKRSVAKCSKGTHLIINVIVQL